MTDARRMIVIFGAGLCVVMVAIGSYVVVIQWKARVAEKDRERIQRLQFKTDLFETYRALYNDIKATPQDVAGAIANTESGTAKPSWWPETLMISEDVEMWITSDANARRSHVLIYCDNPLAKNEGTQSVMALFGDGRIESISDAPVGEYIEMRVRRLND